jgi:hypothetical protein
MSPWTILAGVLLLVGTGAGCYAWGHHDEALAFDNYKLTRTAAVSNQKAAVATETTKIITQYVPQIQVVRDKAQTIVKQVKVYVPVSDNARYQLPTGFVLLHDAAATGVPLPAASATVLAKPSAIAISSAATVIASNYGLCRTEREKYNALWQWATGQAGVTK